ncbi:hypothetical protein E1267_14185 [Nonomuraea longispora]|uniref:CU044_5270 family protein n=1 Tax=Nonomuraea longispora TaxID=1848320 RepID=A0A4R4NI75_9ACTN|nr:CU044_5270 family protein [Nonomuraea longispora]TDC07127.1 hypothetical protein E1267_14185 [Nonomuraea longispora]
MNDFDLIKKLRSEIGESEPEALDGARERLLTVMARTPARKRFRLPVALPLAGVVAATAAAAVVIATSSATPVNPPAGDTPPPLSARNVLLVAADSAERTPLGSGAYWHVRKEKDDSGRLFTESWTTRDGQRWTRPVPGRDRSAVSKAPSAGYYLAPGQGELSVKDIEALPTDPEALKQQVTEMVPEAVDHRDPAFFPLLSLIAEMPAPAKVRSAAFRALATVPDVQRVGTVEGGEELMVRGGDREIRLVVDPETSRVVRANMLPTVSGGVAGAKWGHFIKLTTEWTDDFPGATERGTS